MIDSTSIRSFFAAKRGQKVEWIKKHNFYREVMAVWDKYHGFDPQTETEVRAELLWKNKFITSAGAMLKNSEWKSAGINHISDICYPNTGRFLSHTELATTFQVTCSFLDMLRTRMSIPLHWRRMLSDTTATPTTDFSDFQIRVPNQDLADASTIGAKALYSLINEAKDTLSTGFTRWTEEREEITINNQEEWRDTCSSPYQATRQTKLQTFHYKIIHRIFPSNSYLARVRIRDSDWCDYCDETDSISHHLFSCAKVRPFWASLSKWFRQAVDLYLDQISTKEYIFGLPKGARHRKVINAILLEVKFYIHRQKRYHDGNLDLLHWLAEFKQKLQVEKWIRSRTGSKPVHVLFTRILMELG